MTAFGTNDPLHPEHERVIGSSHPRSERSLRNAVQQVLDGADPMLAALRNGVSRSSMEHALLAFRKGGWDAVLSLRNTGRARRKLTPEQESEIHQVVRTALPDAIGQQRPLWNREALLDLIESRTGIRLPERTITTYMVRWGFLPEKPVRSAYRKAPGVVREWMRKDFPYVAMQARAMNGEVFWLGWQPLDPSARPRSASTGTAALPGTLPEDLSLVFMSANRGHVHWSVHHGPVTTEVLTNFLERALLARSRPLMVIVQEDPLVDRGSSFSERMRSLQGRLELFRLPMLR